MPPTDDRAEQATNLPPPSCLGSAATCFVLSEDAKCASTGWPATHAKGARPRASFRAVLMEDGQSVAILRVVELGQAVAAAEIAWYRHYASAAEAEARFRFLEATPRSCVRLGSLAWLFGPACMTSELEIDFEVDRRHLEEERIRLTEEVEEDRRLAAEEAEAVEAGKKIHIWLAQHKSRFQLLLKRISGGPAVWTISFLAKWERDRFYDWCRWQEALTWSPETLPV